MELSKAASQSPGTQEFIAKPCALRVGIKDSPVNKVEPNDTLEKVFVSVTKYPDEKRLKGLSKQSDWSVRKIQCWFRHRRNQDKPPTLTKFCESMWRFTYYLCIFCYGIRFLWSDFSMMFIHHMIGIMLTTFSYVNNMVRVGALIFCSHDFADPLSEAAKMANYARRERLCTTLFVIFGAAFIVSRLAIFPLWISNTTLFESWEIIGPYPSWWLFNALLSISQVLHAIWSYLIVQTASKALSRGKVSKDDRSDVESSSEEEDETTHKNNLSGSSSSNGANCMNGYMGGSHLAEEQGTCKATGNLHFRASPHLHSCD